MLKEAKCKRNNHDIHLFAYFLQSSHPAGGQVTVLKNNP